MSEGPRIEFTCISCSVVFRDAEIQRSHYKSDWHRYNLKRKVAQLPPVTAEEFTRRVLAQKESDAQQQKDTSQYCTSCRKSFSNEKAYSNHLNSKKHKENEKLKASDVLSAASEDKPMSCDSDSVEEVDSDEWSADIEIDVQNCMFCKHHSRNMLKNLAHMAIAHSFFIPDVEFCVDVKGLLEYLGEKIESAFMCLWCNEKGKTYHSAEAAKQHMLDKGHCKMLHEGLVLAEYVDFYDYTSSYPDASEEGVDGNEEVNVPELDGDDYQLVLPSGAIIGHRSLMRYYRQSIDPNRAVVPVAKGSKKLHKVLVQYRALGWSPAQQEASTRRARDLHFMKRMYSKAYMKLGVRANKLQKHFREQVNY